MQRSQQDGRSPRAYSSRYGQWLLICTTINRSASGRSSLKQTSAAAMPADARRARAARRANRVASQPISQPPKPTATSHQTSSDWNAVSASPYCHEARYTPIQACR